MSIDRPAASPAISDSAFSQSSRATKRQSGVGLVSSSGGNPQALELGDFEDIDLGSHDPGDGDTPTVKRGATDLTGLGIRKSRSGYEAADSGAKLWRKSSPKRGSFGAGTLSAGLTVGSPTRSSESGSSRPTSRRGPGLSGVAENGVIVGMRKISRHRRTSSEIERVYDSDDSIPPETVFHNVPVSPSVGLPISPKMSNLHPAAFDPEVKRPTTGGSDGAINSTSMFAGNPNPFSRGEAGHNPRRVVSFHEAMSALDDESQRLSRQLGKVNLGPSAVRRKHSEDVTAVATNKPLPELSKQSRRATSHTHLPSTSTLWDPLPVSKEKEAVLSQTRPSWLPPKKKSEEKRHLAEYQRMVQLAEEAEIRRQQKAKLEKEEREQLYEDTSKVWQNYIIPNWDKAIRDSRTRALWWNGVPSARRGTIWQKCFGNTLMITQDTYRKALARVADADYAITQSFQDDDVDAVATLFGRIEKDCASVFPDLKIFQPGGPLHDDLINVTKAYSFYRSGFAYIAGSHAIAATLLINLEPFNAFVALANALNRPLALVFLSGDEMAKYKFYTQFDELFQTNLETLHAYFTDILQLHPSAYLDRFFRSFFALYMPLEILARVWDIFVFEGDKILLCTAVAVLAHFEMVLYEERDAVLRTLTAGGPWDLGKVDVFIKRIADIREKS